MNPIDIHPQTFSTIREAIARKKQNFMKNFHKTDFKLMVAQQSGKGPNLKVVKWW